MRNWQNQNYRIICQNLVKIHPNNSIIILGCTELPIAVKMLESYEKCYEKLLRLKTKKGPNEKKWHALFEENKHFLVVSGRELRSSEEENVRKVKSMELIHKEKLKLIDLFINRENGVLTTSIRKNKEYWSCVGGMMDFKKWNLVDGLEGLGPSEKKMEKKMLQRQLEPHMSTFWKFRNKHEFS